MAKQQGITYDTAQEGPFYRVRPHGVASGFAATSGNIESHRDTGQGQQGLSRDTVPQPLTDEAVKGIIKGPDNAIRHAAEAYTKQHLGKPYKPVDNSSSSLSKQGAIGRTFLLAATDHPEYKKAVYEAYKRHMPEHVGEAQDYDQLLQKAYGHLAHETKRQFESLPINMSFHRNGEGNYQDSKEMMRDVHGHRHLYVFQGGDRHDFLHNVHPESGLNDNEMFRAVHDVYGHALHGTTFGPQGEEKAWAAHSGMFSQLAQAAMTAETRGQNSVVNYTPLNARIKAEVAALDETAYDAKRKGRMDLFEAAKAEKKNLLDNHFQFAPQRAVLLPPEMNSGSYAGGIPAYIRHLIQPEGGETAQLTHFSHEPNLTMTDPTRYGTGIKGAEASRLQEPGAVRDRTYFYAGNPERGEVGLGTHKYKAMVDKLYDMGADPLMLRKLAVEANRTPHTSMVNPGLVDQVQAANDYERLIKDYGYNGMINRNLSMPTAAVFNPVPVQKYADGNSVKPLTLPDVHKQTIGLAQQLMADNPKMDMQSALEKAGQHLSKKFDWEHDTKPALEKTYGALQPAEYSASAPQRQKNTPEVVQKRIEHTQQFLSQPTEPWQPPPPEKQAFDRAAIKHALGGFPDVEQSKFPRDVPPRANIEHVHEVYQDPVNRELIKKQILRGLPLGGETFYASLYPVKLAAMEAGIPEEKFNSWIHSIAPASARNSIMNEMAVGQAIRDLHARGVELTPTNMEKLRQEFKEKHGVGLPMMPSHEEGVASVLNNNTDLRQHSLANIPTNYKIPTYGTQKAGDFAHSWVGDVHEAAGETLGSPYHPYFKESGGFKNLEYGAAENHMLDIAKELGIPGGMAQAGRWFGGGELTGLVSPRGDALDLLEKQVAYSLHQQGINPTPKAVRDYTLNMIKTGRGTLLPWFKKSGMPDVRTVKKDGGSVEPSIDEMQAALALRKPVHLAIGGQGPRNWMKGVEGVINPLKGPESPRYNHINDEGQAVGENYGRPMTEQELQALSADPMYARNKALNKWVESNLGNYIRKQMATPNDPIRKLAEEGIVHMEPEMMGTGQYLARGMEEPEYHRQRHGGERLGKSEAAKAWEDASDVSLGKTTVGDVLRMGQTSAGSHHVEPWMEKADPKTELFHPTDNMHAHYLGFDHIVDILKQDLAEGRIRPDQLNKISIEQAVRRAHEYNEERKRKMAETALKATEGMPVHKDYGNGFRWLELALDKNLPEGWSQHPSGTYTDPQGVNHVQHPNYSKLEEALKYEGDTMGHCVGGYCPDVASGNTRIFSLRDKKNEPHVTIEVEPKGAVFSDVAKYIGKEEADRLLDQGVTLSEMIKNIPNFQYPQRINQIKGKGNAKPAAKYIPYAQDFVKSGNWTNVEDLHHADMVPIGNNKYLDQNEAKKHYEPRIKMAIEFLQNHPAFKEQHAAKEAYYGNNYDYHNKRNIEKVYQEPLYPNSSYTAPDLLKSIKNPQDYVRNVNEHYPSLNYWLSEAEKGMAHHGYEPPVQQKARGGIVYKATGGSMPSLSQMQAELMMKQPTSLSNITNVGAEEAPNLPVKDFILPHGQHPGQLPVGGIDMQPAVPGQQLWPTQPPAPGQQPQQGQQQPQQGGQLPQGGPQGQPPSNILQMTPQGRAMGAMQPQQPAAMARGGSVPSKYEVKPYHDDEGKRVGWSVHEGDYIHDVYPTKAYAVNVMKQWIEHDKKKNEPQQAKKGGTIKPVGHGITKEKVTISPNLDAMQYELMSVKHFKKAK